MLQVIVARALAAPKSRHAVLRFRFNHLIASIVQDTFPKVMETCFPDVKWHLDRSWWYVKFPNGSEIWFGGLDDKERTDKILGQEYASIFLNEVSQIDWGPVQIARTRLAQRCEYTAPDGSAKILRLKMFYDCNPPSKAHWSYKVWFKKVDPESGRALASPEDYATIQMNPQDNADNLAPGYIQSLAEMSARMAKRFSAGEYGETAEGALWTLEMLDKVRHDVRAEAPQMLRIVVAVDPSGAGDEDNAGNDEIGIVVCGLGIDGAGWVLEDITCKAGPGVWGNVAATAYDRWEANVIVGEKNFGGEMVRFVLQAAKPNVPVRLVNASRGKAVRAEPISALTERGKIRFAGSFPKLEDELCSMTTAGYVGGGSPNRADAMVWGMTELFPSISADKVKKKESERMEDRPRRSGWMR